MKITIYGYGYVGKAVARFLEGHYELQTVDPNPEMGADFISAFSDGFAPTEYAIVCVPTPMLQDGSASIGIVGWILVNRLHSHYLVKSTVPPGTVDRLQSMTDGAICFSPEYVGEGTYEVDWWNGTPHPTDMRKHNFHIFGGPSFATAKWVNIWQKVAGWVATYHQTDAITAELTKYAENMFLATKKVFCTELYKTAQAMGVEYTKLRELWLLDNRIGASMTLVFPDKLAYGGKCLPKDTNALVKAASTFGHDAKLFRAVIDRNEDFK